MTRRYAERLLDIEPHNRQALALKSLAEEKVAKGMQWFVAAKG